MNNELKLLLELQEMDKAIDVIHAQLEGMPRLIEEKRDLIRQAKTQAEEQKNLLTALQVRRKEKEVDIASRDEKIKKHEGELNSLKSNESYRAMLSEIETLRSQKSAIEDEILNLMVETDQAAAELKNLEAQGKKIESGYEAEIRDIEGRIGNVQAALSQEEGKRSQFLHQLPKDLLSSYEYIRERKKGIAIVTISGECCNGCNQTLTPNTINQARKGKELVRCDSCSRILYVPVPEPASASAPESAPSVPPL